jgi:hypothetical protein
VTDQKAVPGGLTLVEMKRVLVRSVEWLAGFVPQIQAIDRILRKVGTEAELGNGGAFQIVVAVHTNRVGIH